MNVGDDQYGGYHGSGPYSVSSHASSGQRRSIETGEAYLLSQATSTAMIAARSILMSGGSEETALRTAKAAAQCVLNPSKNGDGDTIGKSANFLRRRKVKRQAEVVASMALMSAASNVRAGASSDWDSLTESTGMATRSLTPFHAFGPNITITRNDDPSVLSGSLAGSTKSSRFLPPKPPTTPRSIGSAPPLTPKVQSQSPVSVNQTPPVHQTPPVVEEKRPPKPMKITPQQQPPQVPKPETPKGNSLLNLMGVVKDPEPPKIEIPRVNSIRSPRKEITTTVVEKEDPIYSSMSEELQPEPSMNTIDHHSEASFEEGEAGEGVGDEESEAGFVSSAPSEMRLTATSSRLAQKDFMQRNIDPVLFSFTNAFYALGCGPIYSLISGSNLEPEPRRNSRASYRSERDHRGSRVDKSLLDRRRDDVEGVSLQPSEEEEEEEESDDETDFDEETRQDDAQFRDTMETFDQSEINQRISASHSSSCSSCSESSVDSSNMLQELNISSSEEGEIQVRSTVRETMEKIVSNAKKISLKDTAEIDRKWLSYELRQTDRPEMKKTTSVQKSRAKAGKKKPQQKKKGGWLLSKGPFRRSKAVEQQSSF